MAPVHKKDIRELKKDLRRATKLLRDLGYEEMLSKVKAFVVPVKSQGEKFFLLTPTLNTGTLLAVKDSEIPSLSCFAYRIY